MGVPQVVIVGRPNVGKSSIFNWIAGERLAVVDPTAGVTRDRLTYAVELGDRIVEIVDTGGMGILDSDDLTEHIEEQIQTAVNSADLILFVTDAMDGVVPLDEEVARRLRHAEAPIICVANKTDNDSLNPQADQFHRFGYKELIRVSTEQNRFKRDLIRLIVDNLPEKEMFDEEPEEIEPPMKFAVVGRRNVGKSTFVNALAKTDRMITSEIPGTTRDCVDVRFEMDGKTFFAIDTPGLRRRKSVKTNIDYYGGNRAMRSVRRADVVLMFFDAADHIGKVDKQLCDYIIDAHKPCIFVANKWDLLADKIPTEDWADYIREAFPTMSFAPVAFTTATTGRNAKRLVNHAQMLFKQSRARISTSKLNKIVRAALEYNPPPLFYNRRPKVYFATQVTTEPPTLVLFCNNPKAFSKTYRRYLLNFFREHLDFAEVPIRLFMRKRESDSQDDQVKANI
jgi:GTPase